MLQAVKVVKGEPSVQSEVVCTLEQIFFKELSAFGGIHSSLNSDKSSYLCL